MTGFKWSPIVLSALHRNAYSISPEFELDPLPEVINDLMALHVRRGDFEHHCINLNKWSSPYLGWNQMPGLADTFTPVESDSPDKKLRIQLEHCWPSIERIVARVEVSRLKWEAQPGARPLRRLYVLTNGGREWLGELKEMLEETGDWDIILTSRDLSLTFEQQYVAQAIDMAVAERAAVFIGNGVCFRYISVNEVEGLRALSVFKSISKCCPNAQYTQPTNDIQSFLVTSHILVLYIVRTFIIRISVH